MKRVLSGAVAVVLVVSSLCAWAADGRRAARERLTQKKIAQRAVQDRLARQERPLLEPQPWVAPSPFPWVIPVPDPGTAAFATGSYDRCLITVDSSAIDSRFVVNVPEMDSRMIVAPRVTGLPAGPWPYGARRR